MKKSFLFCMTIIFCIAIFDLNCLANKGDNLTIPSSTIDKYIDRTRIYLSTTATAAQKDFTTISTVFEGNGSKILPIPTGYETISANITYVTDGVNNSKITVLIGTQTAVLFSTNPSSEILLENKRGHIPVSIWADGVENFCLTVEIKCKRISTT